MIPAWPSFLFGIIVGICTVISVACVLVMAIVVALIRRGRRDALHSAARIKQAAARSASAEGKGAA